MVTLPGLALLGKRVSPEIGYSIAAAAVIAALMTRMTLPAVVPYCAYFTFYPAIVAVSVLCGLGPGLVATVLSAAAAFYLQPAGMDRPTEGWEIVGLAAF